MRKPKLKRGTALFLLSFVMLNTFGLGFSYAQQTVSGTVVSEDYNEPLPGVNVLVKGTSTGTITDLDGKYTLDGLSNEAVLSFSFIGYEPQSITVGNQSTIDVSLSPTAKGLDEVVVIGYGTAKKSDLTGAVTSVTSDDYKDHPVTNFSQALQGRTAGVAVNTNSGAPGGNTKIRIRGANSVLGNNDPLYVVDGLVISSGIGNININDIENIEVLKDASATAIYGSRGANGVVMITTKKGSQKGSAIQANINIGVSNLAKKLDFMDAKTFATFLNSYDPQFTDTEVAGFAAGTDWQDEVYQQGITNDYLLSFSGGSDKISYYISGSYLDQTGIMINTGHERFSARANINTKLSDRVSLDMNLTSTKSKLLNTFDMGQKQSPNVFALIASPTHPIYTPEGFWNEQDQIAGPNTRNPVMLMEERHREMNTVASILSSNLKINIIEGLDFNIVFGAENRSGTDAEFQNLFVNTANTTAYQQENKLFSWQNSNILTFAKTFNEVHNLTVTGVYELSKITHSNFRASGSGIKRIDVRTFNSLESADNQSSSSEMSAEQLQSIVGRFAYNLMDKYFLTATVRRDGSSKFDDDYKWGTFPAFGLAWRLSEESFMEGISILDNLKLRAGWGQTGNQNVPAGSRFPSVTSDYVNFGQPVNTVVNSYEGVYVDDLKWETTTQLNAGLDVAFYDGRLGLTFDYYKKNTTDLLYFDKIPEYNGGGTFVTNLGEVENKGFDITLTGVPVTTNDFRWEVSFNLSSNKNTVVSLGKDSLGFGGDYTPQMLDGAGSIFAIKVGESLGSFWGYEWQGVYTTAEAAEAAKYGYLPGDNKYLDYDGDGTISSGDLHVIGNSMPDFTWGLTNTFSYKQFGLDITLQGVKGRKVANFAYGITSTVTSDYLRITHSDGQDVWSTSNENAKFANPATSTGKNFLNSSQWIQDASYIKIRNISLSYALDKSIAKFASLKFSISAQNLLTFTKYKGYDPEVSSSGIAQDWNRRNPDTDAGIDMGAYPAARTFTFGLQATF